MTKPSLGKNGPLLAVDFLIWCCFPLAATFLEIWWKGQPFSVATVVAAQTSQPLLWIVDSLPLFFLVWRPHSQTATKTPATPAVRAGTNIEKQVTEKTAKLTKQVADLKAQIAHLRQEGMTLHATAELYRNFVENANESMFALSLEGTMTLINPGFTSLLGKHRDDLLGRHCSTVLPSSSLALVEEQIRKLRNGEKTPVTLSLSFFHQNGKPVEVEAYFLATLDAEGNATGMQSICRQKAPAPSNTFTQSDASLSGTPTIEAGEPQNPFTNPAIENTGTPWSSSPFSASTPTPPSLSLTPSFYEEDSEESSLVTPLPPQPPRVANQATLGVASQPIRIPSPVPPPPQPSLAIPSEELLDLQAALGRVDGDRELLVEMAELFLDEYPRLLTTLRDAVAHGNAPTAAYAAHTLKGSVANFAATPAFTAAQKLERIARQGDLTQAHVALADLEAQLTWLKPVLANLKVQIAA